MGTRFCFIHHVPYIPFYDKKHTFYNIDKLTGSTIWETSFAHLMQEEEQILYKSIKFDRNQKHFIFLTGNRQLICLNSETGDIKWQISYASIADFEIDPQTGAVYFFDFVSGTQGTNENIHLYAIDTLGKEVFHREITSKDLKLRDYYEEYIALYWGFFIGLRDDSLFFSINGAKLIYRVNKNTGVVTEIFKHDRWLVGKPLLFENKIFTKDDDEKEQRLLILEI